MSKFRHQIGPLAPIFAFEAAARHGSFTAAAEELGVSQAAVSKQIAALEEWLGVALFLRRHRHVEPTPAGRRLAVSAHDALSSIAGTMAEIRKVQPQPLILTLSSALSRFWLMDRMPDFRRIHPGISLRIAAQDDLDGRHVQGSDLLIRYLTVAPDPQAIRLFGAQVRAMASPDFLARHPFRRPEDMAAAPLIHYDTPDRDWISWEDWRRIVLPQGALPPPTLSVSRYHDAIIAAQQGEGVVLVWQVEDGRDRPVEGLAPIPAPAIPAPGAFYLIPMTPQRHETAVAVHWFSDQAGTDGRRPE